MIRVRSINITGRLRTINSLLEITMKKCIFDIQLMYWPRVRGCKTENHMDSGWFHDRTEGLVVIQTFLLSETPDNPPSFIASQRAICVKLVAKDPLPMTMLTPAGLGTKDQVELLIKA